MPRGVYIRNDEEKDRLRKLRSGQHTQNSGMTGKHHSKESIRKMSIANSGERHWNYGKSVCPFDKNQCDINIAHNDFNETTIGNCRYGEWDTNEQRTPCNTDIYRKKKTTKLKIKRKICRCKK